MLDRFMLASFSDIFLVLSWLFFSTPSRGPLGAPLAPSWGRHDPTWSISEANMAPETEPKSSFLGVQEATYVEIARHVKIALTLKRKPRFHLSGPPPNPPKIDGKSMPRCIPCSFIFLIVFGSILVPNLDSRNIKHIEILCVFESFFQFPTYLT